MQLRNFDLNLLIVMEAIWTTRSVSLAARRLNLAQSTISAALNRLREQLDDKIFVWSGHEMVPTPLGNQLMPEVVNLLDGARALLEESHGSRSDIERRVVIATADYIVALYGGPLIERARAEGRNVVFDFVGIKPQVVNRNSLPDVDLFIFPYDALRVSGLKHQSLYKDSYVCIAAKDNAALHEGMDANVFMRLPHVGYSALPRATFNHESMLWENVEAEANYRLTMPDYLVFPRIVSNSATVAIMPRRLAVSLAEQWPIKWIAPPVPMPQLDITQVWRPARSQDPVLAWVRKAILEITRDWSAYDAMPAARDGAKRSARRASKR